jgi:hypothetical protein
MIKRYTLENKPKFKDGDVVLVDMSVMGSDAGVISGKIVGKGSEHIIDMWMIEFDRDFGPTYPYKVVSVIHTAIVESLTTTEMIAALRQ